MKKLIAFLLLFSFPAYAGWVENSIVGVPNDNSKRPVGFFVTTNHSQTVPMIPIPRDTWVTIDLSNGSQWNAQPDLPEDVTSVWLGGLATVTNTGGSATCNTWATFRAPGDTLSPGNYQIQGIEAGRLEGDRSNAFVIVPVKDRKFEVYWHSEGNCGSTINLSIQAYTR